MRDGQQVMLDARQVKSIDEIMLLNTGLRDGRRRLPVMAEQLKPGIRENEIVADVNEAALRHGLGRRRGDQCRIRGALQPPPARLHRPPDPPRRPGLLRHHPRRSSATGRATTGRSCVGRATDAQRDAYKKAREWIDAAIALMQARLYDRQDRGRLAEGRGVRLRERDGVLRTPVRPRRRARPARAADHQPVELARASGRAQGGHVHRPRDVLPGQGRLLGGSDRGGGRGDRRRPEGDHAVPVPRSCSSPTPY